MPQADLDGNGMVDVADVKQVVVSKKNSVIKLRTIGWDHAYADGDDFDFVSEWIRNHIPETAVWTVKG